MYAHITKTWCWCKHSMFLVCESERQSGYSFVLGGGGGPCACCNSVSVSCQSQCGPVYPLYLSVWSPLLWQFHLHTASISPLDLVVRV